MTHFIEEEGEGLAGTIVRPEPLGNQVYKVIRDAVLTGQFKPGEKVIETRLASQLQTSRSPVREALRRLIAEQLLTDEDGSIRVINPTYEDYRQLYELRMTIESMAAKLAAPRMTETDISQLEVVMENISRALVQRDTTGLLNANADFHRIIVEIAGNRQFTRVFQEVSTLTHFYTYLVLHINRLQTNILAEHRMVLEALKRHDADGAYRAMRDHIMRDPAVIEASFREQQALAKRF